MLVNMFEAKTQLSKLVEAAMRGEDVVIANRGKPMVRLVKAVLPTPKRAWGAWEGLLTDAQIDRAFSPQADAEIADGFLANVQQRALRVSAPGAVYGDKAKTTRATKTAKKPARKVSGKATTQAAPKGRSK